MGSPTESLPSNRACGIALPVPNDPAQYTPNRDAEAFVLELGTALHRVGTPSHRLEETLASVCTSLKLQGQFFSTPTSLWAGFGPADDQRVLLSRIEAADLNLHRLYLVDHLAGRVARGEVSVTTARNDLRAIEASPPRYNPSLLPPTFGLASASVAVFLGGSYMESLVAAVLGFVVGALLLATSPRSSIARLIDFVAGFCATAGALLAVQFLGLEIRPPLVALASLIVLVPGLTLTLAVSELASKHLVSGTARLMHALVIVVSIGFGVGLANAILGMPPDQEGNPAPQWVLWISLAIAPVCFLVIFNARPKDLPIIAASSIAGFFASSWGTQALGPELGASVGALAVGLVANAQARLRRIPAAIAAIPGLMLLVPGSVSMRSVTSLLADDSVAGIDTAFAAAMIAVGIAAGLLFANALLPSRQPL